LNIWLSEAAVAAAASADMVKAKTAGAHLPEREAAAPGDLEQEHIQ
jgi:hypothetical protein